MALWCSKNCLWVFRRVLDNKQTHWAIEDMPKYQWKCGSKELSNSLVVQSVVCALFSLYITFDIYQGTSWTRQQLRRKLLTNQKLSHPSNIRQVVYLSLSPRRAETERGKGRMWLLHPRIPQSHQCLKLRINWIVYSMILLLLTTASNRHKLWVRSTYQHQSLCRTPTSTQVSEHT